MKKTQQPKKNRDDFLLAGIKNRFRSFYDKGKAPLTIMIAPHDEARMLRLRVSVFILWGVGLVAFALIVGVIVFSTGYVNKSTMLSKQDLQTEQLQGTLADITSEINRADHYGKIWGEAVNSASRVVDGKVESREAITMGGDISLLNDSIVTSTTPRNDIEKLAKLRGMMEESIPKLKELSDKIDSQKQLLSEMPTRWPAQDGYAKQLGFLSQLFGPSRDPFTGEWQFHTGVDIAFGFGVPIVAAANGTVVKTDYNGGGYGNYIIVRHAYGFFTRYAHLQRYNVVPGQVIKQGDLLGYMGSTGRSTGPHVHFEVMMGTEIVDPMRYLSINNQAYSRFIRYDEDGKPIR